MQLGELNQRVVQLVGQVVALALERRNGRLPGSEAQRARVRGQQALVAAEDGARGAAVLRTRSSCSDVAEAALKRSNAVCSDARACSVDAAMARYWSRSPRASASSAWLASSVALLEKKTRAVVRVPARGRGVRAARAVPCGREVGGDNLQLLLQLVCHVQRRGGARSLGTGRAKRRGERARTSALALDTGDTLRGEASEIEDGVVDTHEQRVL